MIVKIKMEDFYDKTAKTVALIGLIIVVTYLSFVSIYTYLPIKYLTTESQRSLGATITTILATDKLSDSRSVINTNFANLNTDKMEISTTTLPLLTTLVNLTTIGTIGTGVWQGTAIATGFYAAESIDGDDINSNYAGRSLTETAGSPDTLGVDSEIFTYGFTAVLFATTTSEGISTTTEDFISLQIPVASTITNFYCYADDAGTSTIRASVSIDGITSGTDILYSTGVDCGSGHEVSTSTFETTAIGANDWIHIWTDDAEPTGSRPRVIYTSFTATKND